jgi:hypothetical protein
MYEIIMSEKVNVFVSIDSLAMVFHDKENKRAHIRLKSGAEYSYDTDDNFKIMEF